jgi:hypothetical protein
VIKIKPPDAPQNEAPDHMPWRTVAAFLAAFGALTAGIPLVEHRWGTAAALDYQLWTCVGWLVIAAGYLAIRTGMGGRW